jgi:hypothetical protein
MTNPTILLVPNTPAFQEKNFSPQIYFYRRSCSALDDKYISRFNSSMTSGHLKQWSEGRYVFVAQAKP